MMRTNFTCFFLFLCLALAAQSDEVPALLREITIRPEDAMAPFEPDFGDSEALVDLRPISSEKWARVSKGLDYSGDWPTAPERRRQEAVERERRAQRSPSNVPPPSTSGTQSSSGRSPGSIQRSESRQERSSGGISAQERVESPSRSTPPPPLDPELVAARNAWWRSFFKYLMISLLVLAIAWAAYRYLRTHKNQPIFTAEDGTVITLDNIESYIHEADLGQFLPQVLSKADYAQAIRIYYLQIIKDLSNKGAIRWKKEKTNRDYVRDLRNNDLQQPFITATHAFEQVWYGFANTHLDKPQFETIAAQMQSLLNTIARH